MGTPSIDQGQQPLAVAGGQERQLQQLLDHSALFEMMCCAPDLSKADEEALRDALGYVNFCDTPDDVYEAFFARSTKNEWPVEVNPKLAAQIQALSTRSRARCQTVSVSISGSAVARLNVWHPNSGVGSHLLTRSGRIRESFLAQTGSG